jgi:hypothetical protein
MALLVESTLNVVSKNRGKRQGVRKGGGQWKWKGGAKESVVVYLLVSLSSVFMHVRLSLYLSLSRMHARTHARTHTHTHTHTHQVTWGFEVAN